MIALDFKPEYKLPCNVLPIPKTLIYPLLNRFGARLKPCVEVGQRVLKGQAIVLGDAFNPPIHAATSGIVKSIEKHVLPYPKNQSGACLSLNSDGLDESIEFKGMIYDRFNALELRTYIHHAGIVGLGGAGFPTSIKLDIKDKSIDTLIFNGAECEPYYASDAALMQHSAEKILSGGLILKHILKPKRCVLAIKQDKLHWFKPFLMPEIEIALLPDLYPIGAEKILIKHLLGIEVPFGKTPSDIGVLCQNVATLYAIHEAIVDGKPLTHRMVTVTGSGISNPQNIWTAIGTPIADLIDYCGGYRFAEKSLTLGGPFTGFSVDSDQTPISKSSGLVLIREPKIDTSMACIRCGECVKVCPMGLLPQELYRLSLAEKLDALKDYRINACIECACCDLVCPSSIQLTDRFKDAKSKIELKLATLQQREQAKLNFNLHQARKEREAEEKAENLRLKKQALAQLI